MLSWTDYARNTVTRIMPTLLPIVYFCQTACGNLDGQVQFTAAKWMLKTVLVKLSKDSAMTKPAKACLYFKKLPQIWNSLHSASSAHLYLSASILLECFPCVLCQHHSRFLSQNQYVFHIWNRRHCWEDC